MKPQRLTIAGWLSIVNAVITLPLFVFSLVLDALGGPAAKALSVLLTIATTALFIYVFTTLKDLLHARFDFHDTDTLISVLIMASVVVAAINLLSTVFSSLEAVIRWLSVLSLIPFGVIFIVFAVKLLNLRDNLFGMLKPLSYLTIATGLCFGTIILIPFGLLTSAASDIILGMVFFRAGRSSNAPAA